jgi:GT2 family glycosyltransferase
VIDYLTSSAAQERRLKVILNGSNLGFAAANNIGVQAAGDCEYVVLLNNDTVVSRGWLNKMVRTLGGDGVGLVGPVTNNIGNEARINVDYDRIEDMDAFADRYAAEHAEESFEIGVLAMFCVAMRKEIFDRVGSLDERFGIGMFEDDDYSVRVRELGYRVVCAEDIFIHHWGGASFKKLDQEKYQKIFEENLRKFEAKWGRKWQPHKYRVGVTA